MKLVIVHANSPSLGTVANHIAKVAKSLGHEVKTMSEYDNFGIKVYKPDGIIWVEPVNIPMGSRYAGFYSIVKLSMKNVKQLWYGTTEGTPYGISATYPVWHTIDFVANSMYTANKLSEVGYNVVDIVHHGYDPSENNEAIEYAKVLRKKIEKDFPNKIIFSIVEGPHVRKGWEKLVEALNRVPDNLREKFVVLAVAHKSVIEKILPNAPKDLVYVVGEFGSLVRKQVLALYYISDFVLVPSMAEGFGLPILEANSLGRLAIFLNMEPFNEFADVNANITFQWDTINEVVKDGVEFELHEYDPQYLADAITEAIDLAKSGEYEDRAKRAYEAVREMTITNLYTRLIKHLE